MATVDGDPPVAVADDELSDDQDSSLGNDTASSTQSISSSILDYRRENGRTYHRYKEGKYNLPNDETENERLDLQHHLFLLTFNDQLGLAPPNGDEFNAKRVLDLGTGTGIWAMDYGDEHPSSEVIGIDLSPIQPSFVPPNVQFVIDDIDEEWTYAGPFDYIHSRMMNFSVKDWPAYLQNIFDHLNPGGYVELQEIGVLAESDDGTLNEDHQLHKWLELLNEASIKFGRAYEDLDNFRGMLSKIGFVDIVDTRYKWPSNGWPRDKKLKELGGWNNVNMATALESVSMAPFTRIHGWTSDEVRVFLAGVNKDLKDPNIHAYWPICSVYARKPEP